MWRQAFSELRLHPGRFIATLIAIAISVGFISAISVFVNSQGTAMGGLFSLPISKADLVVTTTEGKAAQAAKAAAGVTGVESAALVPLGQRLFLSNGGSSVMASLYNLPPEPLRWSHVVDGRLPEKPGEVALSGDALKTLKARVGDTLGNERVGSVLVVGETNDPASLWGVTGYTGTPDDQPFASRIAVKLAPAADMASVTTALQGVADVTKVERAADVRRASVTEVTNGFDVFKNLLYGFGGIALLVGAITIANTFTILATQRRRQLALLRTIGATPGQVTRRLLAESFLLGTVGSLAGIGVGFLVAWIGGLVTGSNFFGITVEPVELVIAWAVGVGATVVASVAPSLRAAGVKPLEALQVVPTAAEARRASLARIVVCILAAVAGVGLIVVSRVDTRLSLLWAILAGGALTVAILGAAPLYIAPLLRLGARLFGSDKPTARLALTNAARNPRRAASTATALMLAVGLIVTLQVGLATARSSGMAYINERYPVDIAVGFPVEGAVPADLVGKLQTIEGVSKVTEVASKRIEVESAMLDVFAPADAFAGLGVKAPSSQTPADGTILVSPYETVRSGKIDVPSVGGALTLSVKQSDGVSPGQAMVSPSTYAKITTKPASMRVWVQFHDRSSAGTLNSVLTILGDYPHAMTDGSGAVFAGMLGQILGVLLIAMTALLGVAVVIALVGVGNTLGLSVLERQRESALLRALGMQRASLRGMLLIEAVALVAIGTMIGLAAGVFFGWLGVDSTLKMIPSDSIALEFSLDWLYTVGLIGVCLLAAVVASILPGRRAANATPTEALAVD